MISKTSEMDQIFKSLADSTRRDILRRLVHQELSVSEIANPYDLTYAAISKHVKVLEEANLVHRRRNGKKFMLKTNLESIKKVDNWIEFYRKHWQDVFDKLDDYLTELQQEKKNNESERTS